MPPTRGRERGRGRGAAPPRRPPFAAAAATTTSAKPKRSRPWREDDGGRGTGGTGRRDAGKAKAKAKEEDEDEEIASGESADEDGDDGDDLDGAANGKRGGGGKGAKPAKAPRNETPDEYRIRLAKEVLARVEAETNGARRANASDDDDDADEEEEEEDGIDAVTARLHRDLLQKEMQLARPMADAVTSALKAGGAVQRRTPTGLAIPFPPTCVSLGESETSFVVGSKDGGVGLHDTETNQTKWLAPTGRMWERGNIHPILTVALSSDERYVAAGGADDGRVMVWDARGPGVLAHTLRGHLDAVTGCSFRVGTHVLVTGSKDRSLRVWNAAEGTYMETMYGHLADITSVDSLAGERAVSASVDRTVRHWKIHLETHSQLGGNEHAAPIDCIRMLSDDLFVSGSQDGVLALWNASRRKPVSIVTDAHGPNHWIESIAVVRYSDVIATGSDDGFVRVWRLAHQKRATLDDVPIAALPVRGHVTGLAMGSRTGRVVVAVHAREPRFGRWRVDKGAENGAKVFRLPVMDSDEEEDDEDDDAEDDDDDAESDSDDE